MTTRSLAQIFLAIAALLVAGCGQSAVSSSSSVAASERTPRAAKLPDQNSPAFSDDFSEDKGSWRSYLDPGDWSIEDGVLRWRKSDDSVCLAKLAPARDVVVETTVRVSDSGRACFGLMLRAQKGQSTLALRYYDQTDSLEMLHFERGRVVNSFNDRVRVKFQRKRWYRLKAAAIGNQLFGKIWLRSKPEPDWQFRTEVKELRAGHVGLLAESSTPASFADRITCTRRNSRKRWPTSTRKPENSRLV